MKKYRYNRTVILSLTIVFLAFLLACLSFPPPVLGKSTGGPGGHPSLMPIPEKVVLKGDAFPVTEAFTAAVNASGGTEAGSRIYNAVRRMLHRLAGRTGIFFKHNNIRLEPGEEKASVTLSFKRTGKPELYENESYHLKSDSTGIRLNAETDIGLLRGIETLLQLLSADQNGYYFPGVEITDKPRYAWRGLMLDSCRHFLPVGVIKRNIDGMAAVKLNVLHWHLSEDQGFRVECKTFPKLHQFGSDGLYYTHEQVKDIIAYAGERGIRVMPEFDIPGHSTSWLVGYPELGSAPGPYSIERKYGIMDPVFNPTIDATYTFFDKFFKEMCALFPDAYMHIGGDENNGKHWNANKEIQAFMKKNRIKDNHELQAYFNRKILKILTKYKKKMVGWDEIFQPGLPKTIVIHSWRGKEALGKAAKQGYSGILSNGYYIDLVQSTRFHYLNDPIPGDSDLTPEQRKRILGGEATMWAELVTPETVDSRIWPRTAAIAERLWSPASVNDVPDMYRRLEIIGLQLEELGLQHWRNQAMMLRRLTRGQDTAPLKVLVDVMEPLKIYKRHQQGVTYTFFSPYTRVVDAAFPDAKVAREFRNKVDAFVKSSAPKDTAGLLLQQMETWKGNHDKLLPIIAGSPVLKEIEAMSLDLSKIAGIGIQAIGFLTKGKTPGTQWAAECEKVLKAAREPKGHGELMVVSAVEKLVKTVIESK